MGVGCEKQAEKPTPEANRYVAESKLGVAVEKEAGKPIAWGLGVKSKQKSPPRKLIDMSRSGNWAWEQKSKRGNP